MDMYLYVLTCNLNSFVYHLDSDTTMVIRVHTLTDRDACAKSSC